jgi:hypothetical protein
MSEIKEDLSNQDWTELRPIATLQSYLERLVNKFDYAHPDSEQNQKKRDDSKPMSEDEHKKQILSQIEENIKTEWPSITQIRESNSENLEDENSDSDLKEVEKKNTRDDQEIKKRGIDTESSRQQVARRYRSLDIPAESEIPRQHRPSYDDYEYEKRLYSSLSHLSEHHEIENEPQKPANPDDIIQTLQTRREDRDAPFVDLKDPRNLRQRCEETRKKLNLPEHECDRSESTENSKQQAEASDEKKLEIEEIIDYLIKHDITFKQILSDEDRKKIDLVFSLARDLNELCKEASETLRRDLMKFYLIGKHKWEHTIDKLSKIASESKDESQKTSKTI